MTQYDIFNGDADGLCALTQLRLEEDIESKLVTGTKREIKLLENIDPQTGDKVLALDISLERNRDLAIEYLERGVSIEWFDHHLPGDPISHPNLKTNIDMSPYGCTSTIINDKLNGKHLEWAAVASFGDFIPNRGIELLKYSNNLKSLQKFRELGILINYNSYGRNIEDLHFHPTTLLREMIDSVVPMNFINTSIFKYLKNGYTRDLENARNCCEDEIMVLLPNEKWGHRISGTLAHLLFEEEPNKPHIVAVKNDSESYTVSLRAPKSNPYGAGELCKLFGGGGRSSAGGIDSMQGEELDELKNQILSRWKVGV